MTTITYETWLQDVDEALKSINMPMDDWQGIWPFDFRQCVRWRIRSEQYDHEGKNRFHGTDKQHGEAGVR